ncbi:MAG: hypothetical protein OXK16_00870 [bacterium]|nr:hypothetical protein [bacterium]
MKQAEIPQLISELLEMSKAYLAQEAVAPLRRVARFAGFSLLAGLLFAAGWLMLSIAGLRLVLDLLPDSALWSVLGYFIGAALAVLLALFVMWLANRPRESL